MNFHLCEPVSLEHKFAIIATRNYGAGVDGVVNSQIVHVAPKSSLMYTCAVVAV